MLIIKFEVERPFPGVGTVSSGGSVVGEVEGVSDGAEEVGGSGVPVSVEATGSGGWEDEGDGSTTALVVTSGGGEGEGEGGGEVSW